MSEDKKLDDGTEVCQMREIRVSGNSSLRLQLMADERHQPYGIDLRRFARVDLARGAVVSATQSGVRIPLPTLRRVAATLLEFADELGLP